LSRPGEADGLYWETEDGAPGGEIGPLLAAAEVDAPEEMQDGNESREEDAGGAEFEQTVPESLRTDEDVEDGDDPAADRPVPFHGYYFRVLRGQGDSAPGGARSYADEEGRLTGGCAVIAWPAKYGNSGVMTFMVSHGGIVYEKDLGRDTREEVWRITRFDPDSSWDLVEE
jgi:hypothetical protein